MALGERSYDITVGKGLLTSAEKYFDLQRKILVLTDDGVPEEYSKAIAEKAKNSKIITVPQGEGSKSLETFGFVLREMTSFEMGRSDALVAVGGGVVGDLGGFCASVYMRGIDFYNVPTTLLSQVDSSIGGKTAINLGKIKNVVGAFHQPKGVLIDTETLKTLPKRHISSGLAEAIKMAATSDAELFEKIEKDGFSEENAEQIITAALKIKQAVVEEDERESGLRRILNFGHTLGHGIEGCEKLAGLYHGECVALGMIPMASKEARERILHVCQRVGLPMDHSYDLDGALSFVCHDKKCQNGTLCAIFVDKIGSYRIEKLSVSDFEKTVRTALGK